MQHLGLCLSFTLDLIFCNWSLGSLNCCKSTISVGSSENSTLMSTSPDSTLDARMSQMLEVALENVTLIFTSRFLTLVLAALDSVWISTMLGVALENTTVAVTFLLLLLVVVTLYSPMFRMLVGRLENFTLTLTFLFLVLVVGAMSTMLADRLETTSLTFEVLEHFNISGFILASLLIFLQKEHTSET